MTVQDQDIHHWETWRASPTPQNLSALVRQMQPVMFKATAINQGSLPPAVIEAQAKLEAKKAFNSFDPKKGVKLSTHLTNYLQKVNRLNYKYQEIFSVPENRRIKFKTFSTAKEDLSDNLGREPSVAELADHLNWSKAEVGRFHQEERGELSDSQPYSSDIGSHDDQESTLLAYAYNDMTPLHQTILEHTTGYNGKPVLSGKELRDKLGLTQGQLSYAKAQVKSIIKKAFKHL